MKIKLYITKQIDLKKVNLDKESSEHFQGLVDREVLDMKKRSNNVFLGKDIIALNTLGKDEFDNEEYQNESAKTIRFLANYFPKKDLDIEVIMDKEIEEYKNHIYKGIIMTINALGVKDKFKSKRDKRKIKLVNKVDKNLEVILDAVEQARMLISTPANILSVEDFLDEVKKIGKQKNINIKIMRKKELQKENMNLLLAVGSGAKDESAVAIIEYIPKDKEKEDPIVLVGKGLIYDSGGYGVKPVDGMVDMYCDMGGGATVLAIMNHLNDLKIDKHIVGVIGLCENMIDANSYKNGDIITSRKGLTVEIKHTDAEGRLVLADCLSYACDNYKPKMIFDFATLTGAVISALGEMYTGVFSDNRELLDELEKIGYEVNNWVWRLPFDKIIKKSMDGKIADLSNLSKNKPFMGASSAAVFLSKFVDDTKKWVHFDVAGTAIRYKTAREYDYQNLYGSESCVHLILEYLRK